MELKFVLFGSLMFLILSANLISYSINPVGHDYLKYQERMEQKGLTDLPLAWILMKLFYSALGLHGLYLLNYSALVLTGFVYMNYFMERNRFVFMILFMILFFMNPVIKYFSLGLIRNSLGLLIFTLNLRGKLKGEKALILLSLTHTLSSIYFVLYKFLNGSLKKEHLGILFIGVVAFWNLGFNKISKLIIQKINWGFFQYLDETGEIALSLIQVPIGNAWIIYVGIVFFSMMFFLVRYWDLSWIRGKFSLILLSLIKLFHVSIMMRFLYMTWIPFSETLIENFDDKRAYDVILMAFIVYLMVLNGLMLK